MHKITLNKGHYFLMQLIQQLENKIEHLTYLYESKGGNHYMHMINNFKGVHAFLTGGDPNDFQSNENYEFLLNSYKECMECGIWDKKEIIDPISTLAVEVLPEFEKISSKLIQSESPVGEIDLDNLEVDTTKKAIKTKNKKTKLV
jgi:hypothetical protein